MPVCQHSHRSGRHRCYSQADRKAVNISELIVWGAAESAVTIIAVSIPVLRTLVREVRSTTRQKYYGGGKGTSLSTHKGIVQTTTITVSTGPKSMLPIRRGEEDEIPLKTLSPSYGA